jgi:uncharacterized protein
MIIWLLRKISTLCVTRPWYVMGFFAVLVLAALPLIIRLRLEADLRQTLPADMVQALERRTRLFGTYDLAFLLVQTQERPQQALVAFGEELQRRLRLSPLIRTVEFGYSPAVLNVLNNVALDYAPLFVRPAQLAAFDQLLTPEGIRAQLQKTLLTLSAPGSGTMDYALLEDPLQLRRFVFARLAAFRGAFRFAATSPYFLSPDGKALLIKIEGQASVNDMGGVKATVGLLQQVTRELLSLPAFQGLTVQSTGGYFLAAESERIIRGDIVQSVNLALLLICGLVAWAFRRWGAFFYGQLSNLLGLFLALGTFALIRPQLNALTLGCAAALVGLGDDFTIHVLTHYFAGLGKGQSQQAAVQTVVRDNGGGLLGAAITTIVAFAAFLFASQHFLQDMGLLAAFCIVCCFLLSLTFLPALVVCLPHKSQPFQPRTLGVPYFMRLALSVPRLVLGLSLGLCLGAIVVLVRWPPGFETDLRHIHAANSPVLAVQAHIATLFGGSQEPLTLMLEGTTEEEVLQAMRQLDPAVQALVTDGVLAAATSLGALCPAPADQEAVLQRLRHKDPDALADVLAASLEAAGFDGAALRDYVTRVRNALALQAPLDLEGLKTLGFGELVHSLLGRDAAGAAGLLVLFPRRDLWTLADRQLLAQRLTALLQQFGLRGTLSGLYTVSAESAARTSADFRRVSLLALGFVGLAIALQFRRPRAIALVFLPLVCGTLWTAGLFALCGWRLNFMNIAILPMLLGIGVDNGIHIVHRFYMPDRQDVQATLQFTTMAVFLSTLTTLVGFSSLMLSVNQGIASVGTVALSGMTACLLASLLTLPAALHLWGEKK